MGQSRHNPNSTQYRGAEKKGPELGIDIRMIFEPNAAMKAQITEMRAQGIEGPVQVHEKDMDAVMYVMSNWIVPLSLVDDVHTSSFAFTELHRMPLLDFKRKHKTNFENANMKTAADSIVIADEKALIT